MEAGRVIGGKYRLRREIGKGAMGSVWAAVHESLGRSVAVKFLRPTGVNPDTAAARFVAEARMAARVKHRFVVDIFDFGITEDGNSYMVLELLEGEELGERMYYGPPMLVSDAIRFVGKCLSGLDAVHGAGIVHRDLKPENIFIIRDAEGVFPTLLDFGISKMNGDDLSTGVSLRPPRMGGARPVRLTTPGTVIGTPWYMAPEQLRGLSSIDARADIFAMAVILWEWLVGRVPYDHDNIGDLYMNLVRGGPPDLRRARPDLCKESDALARVLSTAMATRPADRYQSAREMREALAPLADALPQAWTIVQKSIANMSSAEVLGVHFPGDSGGVASLAPASLASASREPASLAPTSPPSTPVAPVAGKSWPRGEVDATEAVALPPREVGAGSSAAPASPAEHGTGPWAAVSARLRAWWAPWEPRLARLGAPIVRRLAPAQAALSGWAAAAGLTPARKRWFEAQLQDLIRHRRLLGSVWLGAALLVVVATFAGDTDRSQPARGVEPLLTSAAAQPSRSANRTRPAGATATGDGASPPAAAAAGTSAAGIEPKVPEAGGEGSRADAEQVALTDPPVADAGVPSAATTPAASPPKRTRRKSPRRRPRLIRSLDF